MGKTAIVVEFSPEIRVETGWGSNGVASGADATTVLDGFAHYGGALLGGGDIHSGNYTYTEAVSYCNSTAKCAAFTFHANESDDDPTGQPAKPTPTYFKSSDSRNTDGGWGTWVKIWDSKP